MLVLVPIDNPVLLGKAEPVVFPAPSLSRTFAELMATMVQNQGCGLAAPQVGIPLRMFVYRVGKEMGMVVNPLITNRSDETIETQEGCLSLPDEQFTVKRHKWIDLVYQDLGGNRVSRRATDVLAIVFQHECLMGRTEIITEDGIKRISDLVNQKYSGKVLSYNSDKLELEFRNVVGWSRRPNRDKKRWLSLRTDSKSNNLICTEDHLCACFDDILEPTKISYVPANDCLGKYIITLPRHDRQKNKTHSLYDKTRISVIVGTLLGDAHISKNGALSFTHGERQAKYAQYKASILDMSGPYWTTTGYTKSRKVRYTSYVNEQLKLLYRLSYQNGHKTVHNLLPLIDETSLAFWYMDDGCLSKRKNTLSITLHTESFSEDDNNLLKEWFERRWGLVCVVARRKSGKCYLRFGTKSAHKFIYLVSPYIHLNLQYKVDGIITPQKPLPFKEVFVGCRHVREIAVARKESALFNIEVEGNHNLFANYNLVHNCDHLDGVLICQVGEKRL